MTHRITAGLLLTGAILLCVGVALGEPAQVLQKASALCLECIGIG